MGDRCSMTITCAPQDVPFFEEYGFDEDHDTLETQGAVVMEGHEINYGGSDVIIAGMNKGIPFHYHHGAGCDYGEAMGAVLRRKHMPRATIDGAPFVVLNEVTGEPDEAGIEDYHSFRAFYERTVEAIAKRAARAKPRPDPKLAESMNAASL